MRCAVAAPDRDEPAHEREQKQHAYHADHERLAAPADRHHDAEVHPGQRHHGSDDQKRPTRPSMVCGVAAPDSPGELQQPEREIRGAEQHVRVRHRWIVAEARIHRAHQLLALQLVGVRLVQRGERL
jgi:hypothetical protein